MAATGFTQAPPLASSGEQTQLRRLDTEISKLRERVAKLAAASGGDLRAISALAGKPMAAVRGGRRETVLALRQQRQQLEQQLAALEGQRTNLQAAAQQRTLARAQVMTRQLPPADQTAIANATANPQAAMQQVATLQQQIIEQVQNGAPPEQLISAAVQARSAAHVLDLAVDPSLAVMGELGPTEQAMQQFVNSVVPQVLANAPAPVSQEQAGGTTSIFAPGPTPEGFARVPFESERFGPSSELVPLGGQPPPGPRDPFQTTLTPGGQLAFIGRGNQVIAGTVPRGGFEGFVPNAELTARLNPSPSGPTFAGEPNLPGLPPAPPQGRLAQLPTQAAPAQAAPTLLEQRFPPGPQQQAPTGPLPGDPIAARVQQLLASGVPPAQVAQDLRGVGIQPEIYGLPSVF